MLIFVSFKLMNLLISLMRNWWQWMQ